MGDSLVGSLGPAWLIVTVTLDEAEAGLPGAGELCKGLAWNGPE
jgi:hypothetical protein